MGPSGTQQQLEVRVALSPLTTLTRMLIDTFGGIPVESPASSSTPGPPVVWGDETHSLPDFLLPAPGGTRTRLREELAQVAATPASVIRRDVAYDAGFNYGGSEKPTLLNRFMRSPSTAAQQHCLAVDGWAAQLLAPSARWFASCLHTELLRVSKLIATEGAAATLNGLHPRVRYADGVVSVDHSTGTWSGEVIGPVVLLPVISRDDTVLARWPLDGPLVLAYGAPGIGTEPQEPLVPRDELCALLGRTRATLLERLGTPRSTSELAGGLALAVSTVSEHLRALEAMGLVARGRTGQYVLYRRTERARLLLALY
jgi:DNA-binding transcriptional ArsR family regulator